MALHSGARQLPLRHISIRVPWNDTGWTGVTCQHPENNTYCMILPHIREKRKDKKEVAQAGQSWQGMGIDDLPPCMREHGSFMAPYSLTRQITHPYVGLSGAHSHFLPTPLTYPPYSAMAFPFSWTLAESAYPKAQQLELGVDSNVEKALTPLIGFETDWLQAKANQLALLDTFFSAIRPEESLCFFYAKRTPLADDTRRVIIGVGRVLSVGTATEYLYGQPGPVQSVLWERPVFHSIRPGFKDGFILPYQEILRYASEHQDEDPSRFVAFVPDDQFWSFSYVSEHVTNDGAIAVLLSCLKSVRAIWEIIPGPWDQVEVWINERLNKLWRMRGPCPGLGAALSAFGVPNGTLVALEIERFMAEHAEWRDQDPWVLVDNLFKNDDGFSQSVGLSIGDVLRATWAALPDERRSLLKLLSRFELTAEQATRFYVHEDAQRKERGINVADAEILANPYLLYETDRVSADAISQATIDRGLFPDPTIRNSFPLPTPSMIDEPVDRRRVRSFVVRQLEAAALQGDTLRPREETITEIRSLDIQPSCPLSGDIMSAVESFFSPTVHIVTLADGRAAYQLDRLAQARDIIKSAVERRITGKRHDPGFRLQWRLLLDEALGSEAAPGDEQEEKARQEKVAALEELFASRLSVLLGPAGTGKTTLLKVLCNLSKIEQGGRLLLAPTGKARVRLAMATGIMDAQTIVQFLLPLNRYDSQTGAYRLAADPPVDRGRTVIIDEASMLTEEQLAAVINALTGVERLILVGDPRQLPPIGAGRPFLDIVQRLTPAGIDAKFPRVAPGYAELTIGRRQLGLGRADLELAEWFSGRSLEASADDIWSRIDSDRVSENLRFVRWDSPDELPEKLLDVLVEELRLKGRNDGLGFEKQTGGQEKNGWCYFECGDPPLGGACRGVDAWQVLSPVRGAQYGVEAINHLLQSTFRVRTKQSASYGSSRKIPKPAGPEGILYGDKVIQIKNQRRPRVRPVQEALRYVANGEIGIVVGQFRRCNSAAPSQLEVEFSSQPGYSYTYSMTEFEADADPVLQLAYALTIHKTQGSEFRLTLVVLPNPCWLLSRELLYTALTRQARKVVILHQGDRHHLKGYASDHYSESARRLTNLFRDPRPVPLEARFIEENLIHRTGRGEYVRSKSEVIVADALAERKLNYAYERALIDPSGNRRYPDFTIEDAESGQTYYWEHLGLMTDRAYRQRWQAKLAWYRTLGILPYEEGGGPNGVLITSQDTESGGIDSQAIRQIIDKIFS